MTLYTKLFNYTYGDRYLYKPNKEHELLFDSDGEIILDEEEPEVIRFNEEKYNDIIKGFDSDETNKDDFFNEYISWQLFDKIPERIFTITYDGYRYDNKFLYKPN